MKDTPATESPLGSSPLARGKQTSGQHTFVTRRIIPACAGETPSSPTTPTGRWDHPRLRGGNASTSRATAWTRGSSPLARGKHIGKSMCNLYAGIIPACAGETGRQHLVLGTCEDHPRLRGGNFDCISRFSMPAGSSPLARGKPGVRVGYTGDVRIIPACAGETQQPAAAPPPRRDHPRLRGGNGSEGTTRTVSSGSSPLARGKLPHPGPAGAHDRIIPACAGETTCP